MPRPDVSDERKPQIINAALRVFTRKGYHGATMPEIAAEAGLSVGGLYWYFKGKDAVVAAILAQLFDADLDALAILLAEERPAAERLLAFVSHSVATFDEHRWLIPVGIDLYGAAAHDAQARGFIQRYLGRYREAIATLIVQGIERGEFRPVAGDTRKETDRARLFTAVGERFGRVDVLFANAGIGRFSALGETNEALFDEVMDTNFKGLFFTLQAALPLLSEGASIILNGSVNAHVGFANASVYSASKAAVHSLARTLSAELAPRGIRVNTLNIGPVETPLYGKLGLPVEVVQGFAQTVGARLPIKRFGQPEEIARAAVFLASADSTFVVGSELTTDGGLSINGL